MTIHSLTISARIIRVKWKCGATLAIPAANLAQARAFAVRYLADLR